MNRGKNCVRAVSLDRPHAKKALESLAHLRVNRLLSPRFFLHFREMPLDLIKAPLYGIGLGPERVELFRGGHGIGLGTVS